MTLAGIALLTLYFAAFSVLAFFSLHRVWLLVLLRRRASPTRSIQPCAPLPRVTIQLPVYNERCVVERLLHAVVCLDYPRQLLDVQVLDDSTDETRQVVARCVARLGGAGLDIAQLTRPARAGFKAGALNYGMQYARGEYILILDADFVPPPTLIRDLLPPMADARVGMVQARWGHLNRHANGLTRAQALLLDAHFLIETSARACAGCFFSFHGTAGLWRRTAIEQCGGWSGDTLTEDLDLSYRAQLAGWRFVFLDDVVVPAELPATLPAFRQQQARWAQGTIATARKLLPAVLRSGLPLRLRAEACIQLTCHVIYPATLGLAITALPALLLRRTSGLASLLWLDVLLALSVIVPTRLFYRQAALITGNRPPGFREMPLLTLTGIALSLSNTKAVLAGLFTRSATFERTPKEGAGVAGQRAYRAKSSPVLRSLDGSLAAYMLLGAAMAAGNGLIAAVPAFGFLAFAFAASAFEG